MSWPSLMLWRRCFLEMMMLLIIVSILMLSFCSRDSRYEQVPGRSTGSASAGGAAESGGRHTPHDSVGVSGRDHEVHAAACRQWRPHERIYQAERQSIQGERWLPHPLMCMELIQSWMDSCIVNHVASPYWYCYNLIMVLTGNISSCTFIDDMN